MICNNNIMNKIIVTSPHRLCKIKNIRDCDKVAGLASDIITNKLNAISGRVGVVDIKGNEYRADHDLNREKSRSTDFRKTLKKTLAASKGIEKCILLDVHSFPDYYFDEAGDINFFKKGETPPDIVIMTGNLDKIGKDRTSISYELFLCLKNNYNVKIISDIRVLDILNESSEHGIPGVLLEFNEKFLQRKKDLDRLCDDICKCVCKLVG